MRSGGADGHYGGEADVVAVAGALVVVGLEGVEVGEEWGVLCLGCIVREEEELPFVVDWDGEVREVGCME